MAGFDFSRFDDSTLEAASNKGLVRRAQRDKEAGLITELSREAAKITLRADDATVSVTTGGVKGYTCSCPSRTLCRHVLAALIFLREQSDAAPSAAAPVLDPIAEICAMSETTLQKAFGRAALRLAGEKLTETAPTIRQDGQSVIVQFADEPEVRFLAGHGVEGMISKASGAAAKELHAAALLAIRCANGIVVAEEAVEIAAPEGPDPEYLHAVQAALRDMLTNIFSGGSQVIEDRLFDLAIAARADHLPNLSARLRALVRDAQAKRRSDVAFDPALTLRNMARTHALAAAVLRNPRDPALIGQIRETYEEAPHPLRLSGAGLEIWTSPSGARGVTCWLREAETARGLSLSLSRGPGQDPNFDPRRAAQQEMVWGCTLEALAGARIIANGIKISPSGRLSAASGTCSVIAAQAPASAGVDDWDKLRDAAASALAEALRRQETGAATILIAPRRCHKYFLDEMGQRLVFPAEDRGGRVIALTLPASAEARGETLAAALEAEPAGVYVKLASEGERFSLTPYAVHEANGAILSLDFPRRAAAKPVGWFTGLRDKLTNLGERFRPEDLRALAAQRSDATSLCLARALDEVLGYAELGGRDLDPGFFARLEAQARHFDDIALAPLARLTRRAATALIADQPAYMLNLAYAIDVAMRLHIGPPEIGALPRLPA